MDVKSRHLEGAHGHIFFRNKVSSNSRWHRRSDETFTVLWRLWQGLPVARCQTKQKLKVVGDGRGHFLRNGVKNPNDMMIVTPLSTQGRGWVQGKPQWRCKSGWPSCRCPRKLKSTPLKMVELQTNQCQNSFWGYLMTVLFLLPLRIVSLVTVHYNMKISISKKLMEIWKDILHPKLSWIVVNLLTVNCNFNCWADLVAEGRNLHKDVQSHLIINFH